MRAQCLFGLFRHAARSGQHPAGLVMVYIGRLFRYNSHIDTREDLEDICCRLLRFTQESKRCSWRNPNILPHRTTRSPSQSAPFLSPIRLGTQCALANCRTHQPGADDTSPTWGCASSVLFCGYMAVSAFLRRSSPG